MNDESKTKGATAGEDESGLLIPHLITREMRNVVELESIGRAYDKHVFRGRKKKRGNGWLTEGFLREVHMDMFGSIWDWAGKYRQSDVNIGIPWHQIPEQVKIMCDDFKFWDSPQSSMSVIGIAARLQNRLTRIHPFKNGNGRHARLITDVFFRSHDHSLPEWPQIQRMEQGDEIRGHYIAAMKQADQEDFSELMSFISEYLPKKKELPNK
jgi:Fic-DOC domain mobile mystery protein B